LPSVVGRHRAFWFVTIEAMTEPNAHETAPEQPDDPNDSEALRDQLKGQTTEHADPPRLEDEGQSGG
jgi:hypothetical protein